MKKFYFLSTIVALLFAKAIAQPLDAPTAPPVRSAGDVFSVYSDAYTSSTPTVDINPGWGQPGAATQETIVGNQVVKMSNLDFQGLHFSADLAAYNLSGYETVHIDVWSDDCTEMDFYLIANDGGGEKPKRLTIGPGWNSYDIPLTHYSEAPGHLLPLDRIFQFKFVAVTPASGVTVYYDNIYFYKSASTPTITGFTIPVKLTTDAPFDITDPTSNSDGVFTYTSNNPAVATISGKTITIVGAGTSVITAHQAASGSYNAASATTTLVVNFPPPTDAPVTPPARDAADVMSVYSEAYTDLTGVDYYPYWGQVTQISEQTYAGNKVQRMLNLNFQGVLLGAERNVSGFDKLHLDIWTPDCESFEVSLIYALVGGGQDEKKVVLTPILNGWNSFDIPLSDYTSQGETVNLTQVFQMKLESTGWVATGNKTVYYDNIYFYKEVPLPVTLANFNVRTAVNQVNLSWETHSEQNNKGFIVQRSQDGINWSQIGYVKGNNISNAIHSYSFADPQPVNGINYYRLLQEDNNGAKTPTEVKSVSFATVSEDEISFYPNPVSETLFVKIGEIKNQGSSLSLINTNGNVVRTLPLTKENSNSTVNIGVQDLQNGVYILVLKDGEELRTNKLVVN